MTIFEKIEADMNTVEGTALEKLMESFYHTAMKYCNKPNKYLEDKLLYYFGINVDDYKCKDEKQLDEIGKDITVMLNALYLGKITCATYYMKRILKKSRNVESSPIITAFSKNVDMIIRSCMFTSPVLKASHALIDEFHLFQHLSTITDIQRSLEWSARDNLVAVLFEHLFRKESDYPKDDPKPVQKLSGGTMIDSGFAKGDNDKPTTIEPSTPSSTPSVDTIASAPRKEMSPSEKKQKHDETRLLDVDILAQKFLRDASATHATDTIDSQTELYWDVFDGISELNTDKKWSIFSDPSKNGDIAFFDAIHRFYKGVLIREDEFGTPSGEVKINTFIAMLRANFSCFRDPVDTDIHYLTPQTGSIRRICLDIRDRLILRGLYSTSVCPETQFNPAIYLNYLFKLIEANYHKLLSE